MLSTIEDNRSALTDLCARYRVLRLEIFGSAVRADFDPQRSDLDFLVEFLPLREGEYADAYFGLLEGLQSLFGRRVDLVMIAAVHNPFFLRQANREREVLYAA